MGAIETMNHSTSLDAMILSEERALSFRALSSILKMSTVNAQRVLLDYIDSRAEKVAASWLVASESDGVRRLSLVQGKRPAVAGKVLHETVWGVASSKIAKDMKASD